MVELVFHDGDWQSKSEALHSEFMGLSSRRRTSLCSGRVPGTTPPGEQRSSGHMLTDPWRRGARSVDCLMSPRPNTLLNGSYIGQVVTSVGTPRSRSSVKFPAGIPHNEATLGRRDELGTMDTEFMSPKLRSVLGAPRRRAAALLLLRLDRRSWHTPRSTRPVSRC
jgi:hypothetical protein